MVLGLNIVDPDDISVVEILAFPVTQSITLPIRFPIFSTLSIKLLTSVENSGEAR